MEKIVQKHMFFIGFFKFISLLPDFIVYLASIVTIICVYYTKSGNLQFNVKEPLDWIIIVISLYILIIGVINIYKKSKTTKRIKVNKNMLKIFNIHFWKSAISSVIIIAGDVSWINDNYSEIIDVKKEKRIDIFIYYDKKNVNKESITILKKLADEGVILRKYPKSENLNIRCLVIDKDDRVNQKLITYEKIYSDTLNMEIKYNILIHEENDNKYLMIVKYLLDILAYKNENKLLVGFSGTNNVGKTTIAKGVNEYLIGQHYEVILIDDIFRKTGQKTEKIDNINALLKQLNEIFDTHAEIVLVDHTPLDTLAFIKLFDADIYNTLYAEVVAIMHRFDCLFNISIKDDKFNTNSKLVNKDARKMVYTTINEIYQHNSISVASIENHKTNMSYLEKNIKIICNKIINKKRERML